MGEFWDPSGAMETCKGMASAGHVYGKPIIGAEAFTAGGQERWLHSPRDIKALGDQAFCEGINRFVFHRYAMQPWVDDRRPGMTMGPWGQHYERTQTWWDLTPRGTSISPDASICSGRASSWRTSAIFSRRRLRLRSRIIRARVTAGMSARRRSF